MTDPKVLDGAKRSCWHMNWGADWGSLLCPPQNKIAKYMQKKLSLVHIFTHSFAHFKIYLLVFIARCWDVCVLLFIIIFTTAAAMCYMLSLCDNSLQNRFYNTPLVHWTYAMAATYGTLTWKPSRGTNLYCLVNRGTLVWTTCPRSLPDNAAAGSWTRDLPITSPTR